MKGLLIKDGRLMITQGKTLLGIAVFMIVCSFLQGDSFPQFAASYSIMMTTILSISTVSYDEYDNGIKIPSGVAGRAANLCEGKILFWYPDVLHGMGNLQFNRNCRRIFSKCRWVGRISDFQPVCSHAGSSASWYLPSGYLLSWSEKGRGIYTGMLACIFFAAIAFFKLKWNVALMENEWFQQMLLMMERNRFPFIAMGMVLYLGVMAMAYLCAVKIMEHREF